ncbi:hypothetical protein ACFQ3L_05180 [Lacticaseibacillus jixianensis]|uniref:ATP-grasp domain-containing protein n=1 Tax=Lacticaseibacillus jixianensis TaxID=2486012 RepID=A0ABW4B9U2_9LACO|nr:carboxylate--amine ligase [Lacticaseibacillus jixianensis]
MTNDFLPVIVGTDINAYTMAISFHQEYGITPQLIGQAPLSFTEWSSITTQIEYHQDLRAPGRFVPILMDFAKRHAGKPLLLIGTNDAYVRLIVEHAAQLGQAYRFNYPTLALLNTFQHKSDFYQLCDQCGIPHPVTKTVTCTLPVPQFDETGLRYPVIVKPNDTVKYMYMQFAGKEKVFKCADQAALDQVLGLLAENGYRESVLVQEYIPGGDDALWDSVVYVDRNHRAEMVTLAQVVLQEHDRTAIGNYTALIARFEAELMNQLADFLEAVGYTGYANFDMKRDPRDGQIKIFEANTRQGRASYYITGLGQNLARNLVDDCIKGECKPRVLAKGDFLYSIVPKYVLHHFVKSPGLHREIDQLIGAKHWVNPLFYPADLNGKRRRFLLLRQLNYVRKYYRNRILTSSQGK